MILDAQETSVVSEGWILYQKFIIQTLSMEQNGTVV